MDKHEIKTTKATAGIYHLTTGTRAAATVAKMEDGWWKVSIGIDGRPVDGDECETKREAVEYFEAWMARNAYRAA